MNRRFAHGVLIGIAAMPFLYLAVGACLWGVILSVRANEMGAASVAGPHPMRTMTFEGHGAKKSLHHHFARIDEWIRHSKEIEADVGKVIGVAPIGSPNSYDEGVGESWARMNLQVIGENGEGILYLPDVCR